MHGPRTGSKLGDADRFRDFNRAMAQALAPAHSKAECTGWLPMDKAPRVGTKILAWVRWRNGPPLEAIVSLKEREWRRLDNDRPVARELIYFLPNITSAAALVVLAILIARVSLQAEGRLIVFYVLVGLLANAAICGVLSEPVDRYQARLIWLLPLLCVLCMASGVGGIPFNLHVRRTPRVVRFLVVGTAGLFTDLATLTLLLRIGFDPLTGRVFSLVLATVVTWQLNRSITFDPSHLQLVNEALRYGLVTMVSQGISYVVYSALVLSTKDVMPQAAAVVGAAVAAGLSYTGHLLFSFGPPGQARSLALQGLLRRNSQGRSQ